MALKKHTSASTDLERTKESKSRALLGCPHCGKRPCSGFDETIHNDESTTPYAFIGCCAYIMVDYEFPNTDYRADMTDQEWSREERRAKRELRRVQRDAMQKATTLWNRRHTA